MAEEIGFENGRNSNFEGLVTLTLTLDPVIRHTVVHHSSTSTIYPISLKSKKLWTDGRTDGLFSPLILLGRLLEVDLKIDRESLIRTNYRLHWQRLINMTATYTLVIALPAWRGFLTVEQIGRISFFLKRAFKYVFFLPVVLISGFD